MSEDKELMLTILDTAKNIVKSTDRTFEMYINRNNEKELFSKVNNDVVTVKFTFRKTIPQV